MNPRFVLIFLGCLCVPRGSVGAASPTPATCTVSPLVACPAGDMKIQVVVRRSRAPLAHSAVTIDLGGCQGLRIVDATPADSFQIVDGCRFVRLAGGQGTTRFGLHGGAFACPMISVLANGVPIAQRMALASPDQNADLVVDMADIAILESKVGKKDATADLDGDGRVTDDDVTAARAHIGHRAYAVTPSQPTTWGEIKAGYR